MMFERFTDRARRTVVLAQEEARGFGHDYIGTEHLLLGLVTVGGGMGVATLESLGVSPALVRERVEQVIEPGPHAQARDLAFTPRAREALKFGLREALALNHSYIGTEHILLGLIRENGGVAGQVLAGLDVNLGLARQRVERLLAERQVQ
jgi:ATP-dependent Clp protease ATP-binding subunit ClpC